MKAIYGYGTLPMTDDHADRSLASVCEDVLAIPPDLTARHERMAEAMWEQHRSTAGYMVVEAEPWGDLPASWHAHWIAMARAADTARDAT